MTPRARLPPRPGFLQSRLGLLCEGRRWPPTTNRSLLASSRRSGVCTCHCRILAFSQGSSPSCPNNVTWPSEKFDLFAVDADADASLFRVLICISSARYGRRITSIWPRVDHIRRIRRRGGTLIPLGIGARGSRGGVVSIFAGTRTATTRITRAIITMPGRRITTAERAPTRTTALAARTTTTTTPRLPLLNTTPWSDVGRKLCVS